MVSSNDEFLRTTLGIVYYRQSKFDDALAELSQAVEINPKSATARNYLGLTAIQKGRPQEAEKEILQAIANNPDYGDAHFNLAVILATTEPASKEFSQATLRKGLCTRHPAQSVSREIVAVIARSASNCCVDSEQTTFAF